MSDNSSVFVVGSKTGKGKMTEPFLFFFFFFFVEVMVSDIEMYNCLYTQIMNFFCISMFLCAL